MPDVVGRAIYQTEVDKGGLERGLDDAERRIKQVGRATEDAFSRQGTAAVGRFRGALDGMLAKVDGFARKGGIGGALMGGVGLGAGLGAFGAVQGALGGVVDFAKGAIDAASDLSESMSKVGVVFGASADAIESWSDTAATAMGLSKQEALEAAGTFGNLFDALRLSEDATRDMSKGAVQLAADLASFNNADISDTLAAIQSGLVGEAEPMRRFGSNLSAVRVEAYALAQGWAKSAKGITDAMKVQARYNLILQDTVNASGDFARTSDGLANSQRILNAEIANLTAEIGTELQPVMRDLAVFAKDTLVPALREVMGMSDKLGTVLAILSGNVIDQNHAVEDYFASLDPWTRMFTELGKRIGYTRVEVFRLSQQFQKDGKTIQEFGRFLGDLAPPDPEDILPDPAGFEEAAAAMPAATKAAVKRVAADLSALVGISRRTLRSTRDEVRDRMRDIRDALEHPFRDDRLEKEYRSAIRRATRAMNRALRSGNEEAYAEASEFVREYKKKLAELRQQRFRVRVSMFVDGSGVTGPGATLLGGIAGSAWGYRPSRRASGGPVSPFRTYLVGERGPELLTMGASAGHVTPNESLRGGSRTVRHVHELAPGAARQLRSAGFDDRRVAGFLLASPSDVLTPMEAW